MSFSSDNEFEACEEVEDDLIDRLPADPFGMFKSELKTQMEDFGSNISGYGGRESGIHFKDHMLTKGVDCACDGTDTGSSTMPFQQEEAMWKTNGVPTEFGILEPFEFRNLLNRNNAAFNKNFVYLDGCDKRKGLQDYGRVNTGGGVQAGDGSPNSALLFTLKFLDLRHLLEVQLVCKTLCDAIRGDNLLWRSIHVDGLLSQRITDDALVRSSGWAQGTLQCLSLVNCSKITDDGLRRVLEGNQRLTKLSVPECRGLTIDGILRSLRAFTSTSDPGIKYLRIGGIRRISSEHFEEFKMLLGADNQIKPKLPKPQFYTRGKLYLPYDDDRVIDVEMCPKCQNVDVVYDCPCCQGGHEASQLCRACKVCIERCVDCGRCIENCDYEEMFNLDNRCLDCGRDVLNCQGKPENEGGSSSSSAIFHQNVEYHFNYNA